MSDPTRTPVDPERLRGVNAFDQADGYSGQDYTLGREIAEGARAADAATPADVDGRDLPPEPWIHTPRTLDVARATGTNA